ncbi:MAG: Piwi domain-containing protein [Phycisphaerales bacterium]
MPDDYRLHLNILPIVGDIPAMLLHRRPCSSPQEERPTADSIAYRLREGMSPGASERAYWFRPVEGEGFQAFECDPFLKPGLTQRMLFRSLKTAVQGLLDPNEFWLPASEFRSELSFIMHRHNEGHEELVVEPYFLRATRQFGFVVDFHFRKRPDVPFDRNIQRLSLSLNRDYRRNTDHYLDRSRKIRQFVEARRDVFGAITLPGHSRPLMVSAEFVDLPADRLRSKTYIFGGGRESRGQFNGLREHGPLVAAPNKPKLLFVFRESDRASARMLAAALKGGSFAFPGFQAVFKTDVEIDRQPIVLTALDRPAMDGALATVKARQVAEPGLLPVLVLPSGEDNGYMVQKSIFSHSDIPTQACTLRVLKDADSLKWAVASIALQVFCKAGGQPWKVRPTLEKSLIIGISQSHKVKGEGPERIVEKHFAFSVLTDSSGLFKSIQVLGNTADKAQYIESLKANLRHILESNAEHFGRVVLHTTFKLRRDEMEAIEQTVKEVALSGRHPNCRFAVLKVNQYTRFFGTNRGTNSLVPFEASRVRLGHGEYLLWFEGIYPDRPIVSKCLPGPTHVQFLRLGDQATDPAEERELLQDLVNLSGANWRGFNARSSPVSVYYCQLFADFVHEFHTLNLPLPAVENLRPWFL